MEQRSATPKSEKRSIVRPILFGFAAEPVPGHNSTGEQCVTLGGMSVWSAIRTELLTEFGDHSREVAVT